MRPDQLRSDTDRAATAEERGTTMRARGTVVAGIAGVTALAAWVATPIVSMARHGTLDQRTVRGWRNEDPRIDGTGTIGDSPETTIGGAAPRIPAPRHPADSSTSRRSSLRAR